MREFWDKLGAEFAGKPALQVVEYILGSLVEQGEIIFLTAFGPEGCVLLDMISKIKSEKSLGCPEKRSFSIGRPRKKIATTSCSLTGISYFPVDPLLIANLDTGYQFKETLELKAKLEERYGINIELIKPEFSVPQQDEIYGKDLFNTDPDQCCYMRKIKPLAKLLEGKFAWITGIRQDQTLVRADAGIFEFDNKFKIGKINPLVHWTKSDVWKYIHENKVPYNPLLDQGYDSIGCQPCTTPGTDRGGRWAGKDKIECGLHLEEVEGLS